MWVFFAFGSALFAGITAILAKIGVRDVDSNVATAVRTAVVLAFAWLMVLVVGSQDELFAISVRALLFLVLSGLATGVSWLSYFRALQLGDLNKVTPIDRSSTVLTMLLAALLLGEPITPIKGVAMGTIAAGTYLMIQKRPAPSQRADGGRWLPWAVLSAVSAALTSILGKVGIEGVESNLGTAIRTAVVLPLSWLVVLVAGKQATVRAIDRRSLLLLCLSGIATGASWLCFYRALQTGPASVVVPIDKLSILPTVAFSHLFLGERLSMRALVGLLLVAAGTLALLL